MAFHVEIQPQAYNDLDQVARYIKNCGSFAIAAKWFNGIMNQMGTLQEMPERRSIAQSPSMLASQFACSFMAARIELTKSFLVSSRPLQGMA